MPSRSDQLAEHRPAHPTLTLAATILASSLAFVDGSVVNVALPSIGHSLKAGAADLPWTINAYLLPLSALLLIGGAAGDHYGRKRLLIGGIALFALASLACAAAPSLPLLIAARAVQGVGAAMLMPNSLSLLGASFEGEARGRAVGTWASTAAIASAVGPPLGGWLVGAVGWRAVFAINLPVAAAAILITARFVADPPHEGKRQPLDAPGAALAMLGLGALAWALTLGSAAHRFSATVAAGLIVGAVALALLVAVERRRGERAMMPPALFATRAFLGLTIYTLLLYGALGGLIVLLPYTLIQGCGYSPTQAGLALLPFSLAVGLGSRAAGALTARIGPRWPLTIGPAAVAVGFALMTRVTPERDYWSGVFPGMLVVALGMAVAVAPLTTAVLSSVDAEHTGAASGFNSAVARTGGLIATAAASAVIGGTALVGAFHLAALAGSALAAGAAAAAFATLDGKARA